MMKEVKKVIYIYYGPMLKRKNSFRGWEGILLYSSGWQVENEGNRDQEDWLIFQEDILVEEDDE